MPEKKNCLIKCHILRGCLPTRRCSGQFLCKMTLDIGAACSSVDLFVFLRLKNWHRWPQTQIGSEGYFLNWRFGELHSVASTFRARSQTTRDRESWLCGFCYSISPPGVSSPRSWPPLSAISAWKVSYELSYKLISWSSIVDNVMNGSDSILLLFPIFASFYTLHSLHSFCLMSLCFGPAWHKKAKSDAFDP